MSISAVAATAPSLSTPDYVTAQVMAALQAIRATAVDGSAYGTESILADAGFTSMEMVNVMLAIEGVFDLTIPQTEITPNNFATPATISALVQKLKA